MSTIELSSFSSESAAMLALVDPSQVDLHLRGAPFQVTDIEDEWGMHGGSGFVKGYFEVDGNYCPASIYIVFPGIIERSLARIRGREPRATLNMTVNDFPDRR